MASHIPVIRMELKNLLAMRKRPSSTRLPFTVAATATATATLTPIPGAPKGPTNSQSTTPNTPP